MEYTDRSWEYQSIPQMTRRIMDGKIQYIRNIKTGKKSSAEESHGGYKRRKYKMDKIQTQIYRRAGH